MPWQRLRGWIEKHVADERALGRPATLSQAQLEAVSVLVSFGDEPKVGDRDYVSLLLRKEATPPSPVP